jgi:predicted enzyme related to lactoylglutathione lyase
VVVHGPAPMTDRMRVAHLKDPEGNLVELQEWLLLRG